MLTPIAVPGAPQCQVSGATTAKKETALNTHAKNPARNLPAAMIIMLVGHEADSSSGPTLNHWISGIAGHHLGAKIRRTVGPASRI